MSASPTLSMPFLSRTGEWRADVLDDIVIPAGTTPEGRCGGRAVRVLLGGSSLVIAAAFGVMRWYSLHPVANGLSTIAAGMGVQAFVQAVVPDEYMSRVQQVSETVFGQSTLFLLSQLAANASKLGLDFITMQAGVSAGIGVMLGMNLAIMGKQWIDSRFGIREFNLPDKAEPGAKFQCAMFSEPMKKAHYVFKAIAVAGCATGWGLSVEAGNTVLQGIMSWGTCYYATEPVAQAALAAIDRRIRATDEGAEGAYLGVRFKKKAALIRFRTAVNTLSYLAIPATLVPWGKPRTTAYMQQLWATAIPIGLFSGFLFRSQENELRKTSIDKITALKPRTQVENRAFRVWKVVWPTLIFLGMTAFVIGQWVDPKMDVQDKLTMAAFYLGYLFETAKDLYIDRYWNVEDRASQTRVDWKDQVKDGLVISQILPRSGGINPIYLFSILTSSIALHSGQELDPLHQVLNKLAWFIYGKMIQNEFYQTMGERQGLRSRAPTVFYLNAIMTMANVMNPPSTSKGQGLGSRGSTIFYPGLAYHEEL